MNIDAPGFGPKSHTCASRMSVAFNKAGAPINRAIADVFAKITEQVGREIAKGKMPAIPDELESGAHVRMPVMYCGEIIDQPAVRAAIQKAVAALAPLYVR